ncbi:MAG: hypothetical protein M1839_005236 [Geoglossum umbratile]|nr:MAG: hypothetical protein M1839_005236 [Geoglossum umbratile]
MVDEGSGAMKRQPLYVNEQRLSEELLREIGRGLSSNFPTVQDDVTAETFMYVYLIYSHLQNWDHQQTRNTGWILSETRRLERTLRAILYTAQLPQISQSHRAAACNALTAFLEKCRSSSIASLQSLSRPNYLWTDAFNVYLERSDRAKAKPLRQVLVTLVAIISGDSDRHGARRVLDAAVMRIIAIVFKQEPYSRVKPAIQALDYFISKQVISLQELLGLVKAWLSNNSAVTAGGTSGTSPVYGTTVAGNPTDTAILLSHAHISGGYVTVLATAILHWMLEPDIAPAAGDLFISVFSTLKRQKAEEPLCQVPGDATPAWCGPIQSSIGNAPSVLENLKQHIFPGLFKLSVTDFGRFLEHLRFQEISSGSPVVDGDPQVVTLFIALQTGKEIGLVRGSDEGLLDSNTAHANAVVLPDHLMGRLLARASETIRLAALSLLVASPLTTRPFTSGVLSLLEQNMTFSHADTDAKFRTNVLSTAKRLVDRLRGSASFLSREQERYKKTIAYQSISNKGGPVPEQSRKRGEAVEAAKRSTSLLQRHTEFINWYINFLVTELQPTASYQRHITALKALGILLQSGLDGDIPATKLSKLAQGEIKWPFHIKVLGARACRALLDLLADPFDDVRSGTAGILKLAALDSVSLLHVGADIGFSPKESQIGSRQKADIAQDAARNTTHLDVFDFLSRLEHTVHLSGRADHADGVARTYEIIFDMSCRSQLAVRQLGSLVESQHRSPQLSIVSHLISVLEESLVVARKDLALAVSGNPVHGHLAGIRLILDRPDFYHNLSDDDTRNWRPIHQRIIKLCQSVWECVKSPLCNDSPEGHIPEDFNDGEDLGTKDILSYSWRALKESSTTLRVIISNATHNPCSELSILDESDIKAIGQLTFTQLAELRHRGAFSTVSSTFATCCQRCFKEKNTNQLLYLWYKDTLNCIQDQASTTTRRSAGIPSLITGIMTAEPGGPLFAQIILKLLAEAQLPFGGYSRERGAKLPQVHALNCLKDTFADSRLGSCSEVYLAETLELSVECLGSEVWAIRNCGIMLFRALVDRLFGTNESRNKGDIGGDNKVTKLSYDKYPSLPGLLKDLLGQPTASSSPAGSGGQATSIVRGLGPPEAVFSAMDIIRRAGPPKANDAELRQSILSYIGSKIWHVRDMAARTFCSLVDRQHFTEEVSYLVNLPWASNNALHGQLLCARYLLRAYLPQDPVRLRSSIQSLIPLFHNSSGIMSRANICPINKGAFLDIANVILEAYIRACCADGSADHLLRDLINQLCESMEFPQFLNNLLRSLKAPGTQDSQYTSNSLYRRALVHGVTLYYCSYGPISNLQPMIEALAERDPDALLDVIELLESLYAAELGSASVNTLLDIGTLLFRMLEVSSSAEVKSRAARCISEICESSHTLAMRLFTDPQKGVVDVLPVSPLGLNITPGRLDSPSLVNAELRLWGSILSAQCTQPPIWPERLVSVLEMWSVALQKAGDEKNEFSTRMAAAMSLRAFKGTFRVVGQAPRTDAALLGPYVALYDTLNDDDDEIRDVGATVVSWILSDPPSPTPNLSLVPLAASLRFSEWLSLQYSHSASLSTTAVRRLTLHSRWLPSSMTDEELKPVEDLLANATKEDRSLFIEEKQNLFVDEVREADIWSRVLLRMSSEALDAQLVEAYVSWVYEGLLALLEKSKAEAMDGPLGWTAKPEAFALGIYVILGAAVVLKWAKYDGLCDCEEGVMTALRNLAEVGRRTSLHEFWLSRIDPLIA